MAYIFIDKFRLLYSNLSIFSRIMIRNTLLLIIIVTQFLGVFAESNIFQSFENCNAAETSNITYSFNVWVLVPFDPHYKFAKGRVEPALDKALNDAVSDIQKVNSKGLFSALNVSIYFVCWRKEWRKEIVRIAEWCFLCNSF